MKWRRHAHWVAIFALFALAVSAGRPDREAPLVELKSASLLVGATPRVPSHSWATWSFSVRNGSVSEATVDLALNSVGGRTSAVHESRLTIPAGFTLRSSAPVLLDTADRYETSLYVQGNKVDYTESLLRVLSSNKLLLWIVNDDEDISLGDISRNEALKRDFETVYCGADSLPRHWAGFGHVHALVMLRPNFADMSSHSVEAIQRWVARGGTLLFIEPRGVLAASESALSELLPVVPMRMRKLETLTALTAFGGQEVTWPEGIDFLEATGHEHGVSTLVEGDYPVAHFHRHHLGVVGVTLINPGVDGLRNSEEFNLLWRHLLAFGGGPNTASGTASPELDRSLRLLTGISIPEADIIRRVVFMYLLVVLVAVIAGYVCRRRLIIWAGLAAFAVVTTLVIFHIANSRGARKSEDLASVIRFEPAGSALAGSDQVTALFSRKEKTVTVETGGIDDRLRAHMDLAFGGINTRQATGTIKRKQPSRGVRDVLQIASRDSVMSIDEQLLRQAALLRYSCESAGVSQAPVSAPAIDWQATPSLSPWAAADHLANPLMAFIACEAGVLPLQAKGTGIALGSTGVLPPELQALREFFALTGHRSPTLALVHDTDSGYGIPDGFATHGKRVSLLPMHQNLGDQQHLPASRVRLSAVSPGARRLLFRGQWQPLHQSNASTQAVFDAYLPPTHTQLAPEQVVITFRADNRGQNIRFSLALARHDYELPSKENPVVAPTLSPSRVDGDSYHFTQLPADLRHPSDGVFRLVITAAPIKRLPPEQALRTNAWEVRQLGIAVSGTLPAHVRGSF